MERSYFGGLRRRLALSTAGVAVLGSVFAAGPAAADWVALPQGFVIASVGIPGQCLSAT